MPKKRLYQVLRDGGIGKTIPAARAIIRSGRVAIDGIVCTKPDFHVSAPRRVTLDAQNIKPLEKTYYLLHKPKSYSCQKNERIPFVGELIPDPRVSPVGRLDVDTTGLLIMTNDGDLSAKITSPKSKIQKTYIATLDQPIAVEHLQKVAQGVHIRVQGKPYQTLPARVQRVGANTIEIRVREGKKRQVRLMLEAIGYQVKALQRTTIGKLELEGLKAGEYRVLSKEELLAGLRE